MDPMERFLYAGANDGTVYTCGVVELDQLAAGTSKAGGGTRAFLGHRSAVTCILGLGLNLVGPFRACFSAPCQPTHAV